MNTLECIEKRLSIRNFDARDVEREKLEIICKAGLEAPTAMNSREIVLTVVRGERLARLNAEMERLMPEGMRTRFYSDGKFDFYRGGNALIVVSLGRGSIMPEQNTGCIMENMYLAATEIGLGACWINQFYNVRSETVMSLLALEEGYRPYAGLSVGYYSLAPQKKERDGKIVFLD